MFRSMTTFAFGGLCLAAPAFAAPLEVTLTGVEARGAPLYVGVQTEDQFMKNDGIAGERVEAPDAGTHTFSFDLPEGDYSVSVWHDLNANGQFDMADSGMPAEGWAMSNGSALTGEPSFEDVKVELGGDGAQVEMSVAYPAE